MSKQVWDRRPPSRSRPPFEPGEPTRSVTPPASTDAQFVRLARSIDAGRPVGTPRLVACRYAEVGSC